MAKNNEQPIPTIEPREIINKVWQKRGFAILNVGRGIIGPNRVTLSINLREPIIDYVMNSTSMNIEPNNERIFGMRIIWAVNIADDEVIVSYDV